MSDMHYCPRHLDMIVSASALTNQPLTNAQYYRMADDKPGVDTWDDRGGHRYCSYCGSLHPEEFMRMVRDGSEIGPTDKNYKLYVDRHAHKFYIVHLDQEQSDEFRRLIRAGKVLIGYPHRFYSGLALRPEAT